METATMQPLILQLDRAPHRSPARETAPPSLLARTRSAVRDRFRGTVGSDAPSHLDEVPELTDLVTRNVARLARPPRIPRRRVSPLSVDQVRVFLTAIASDRLEALYL